MSDILTFYERDIDLLLILFIWYKHHTTMRCHYITIKFRPNRYVGISIRASHITGNSTLFQRLVQTNTKENIKAPHYWSFLRGIHQWPLVIAGHFRVRHWPMIYFGHFLGACDIVIYSIIIEIDSGVYHSSHYIGHQLLVIIVVPLVVIIVLYSSSQPSLHQSIIGTSIVSLFYDPLK